MDSQPLKDALKLIRKKQYSAADKILLELLETEPENAWALHSHGLVQAEEGNYAECISAMKRALSLNPECVDFHHNLAGMYGRIGESEKAMHHFQEALRLRPSHAQAYQGLAECKSFKGDDGFIQRTLAQLKDPVMTDFGRTYLHFALGKVYSDSKRYDEAFKHYLLGNKLKNARFDIKKFRLNVNNIINTFTPKLVEKTREWGLYEHTPVFVLGMARSGTSLTEQILSSHSSVYGAGEIEDILHIANAIPKKSSSGKPYPFCLNDTKHMDLLGFGLEYLDKLRSKSDASRVVNKLPGNHQYIGLILMMFPNAAIIHTKRDPVDTCLSCFFQNFTEGQSYSYDFITLAEYYNGYRQLMAHWSKLYPGRIHDVQYEQMTADPESTIRALLDYCNLPWEDRCLDFHNTDRGVSTASRYQVRRPIYTSSVDRWKNHEKHLQPLISRLSQSSQASDIEMT
jgi:tetratricopeptide (TPR) repeat protein